MSAQTKILLLFAALTAFAVGIAMNTGKLEGELATEQLLNAKLEVTDPNAPNTVADELKELTLVNFWATWCTPCKEEMPIFETMYRLHKADGFQVVGVAIDNPERAQPFLDSMDISYPILYAEQTGMQILEVSGNAQGLLPYSLLLDKQGRVLEQVLGKIDETQISDWLSKHL